MASLSELIGGSVTEGVAKIIQLFKVDPTVALQKSTELEELKLQMAQKTQDAVSAEVQSQVQVNLAEAQNKSIFISGWRPWVGWCCGGAFAYTYVAQPLLTFILTACQVPLNLAQLPKIDLASMMPVMLGMLGLGVMRSYDKVQGTTNGD